MIKYNTLLSIYNLLVNRANIKHIKDIVLFEFLTPF